MDAATADASLADGNAHDASAVDADVTAPQVLSTSPIAGAIEVPLNTAVEVSFDEPIDPTTLNATSFTLDDDLGVPVAGAVAVDVARGTFTPDAVLARDTTYTVAVTPAVTDLAGNPLAAEHSWSFTTAARAWGTAAAIEAADANVTRSQVAMDAAGNAIAVWQQYDGARYNIWANRYEVGSGWGTPELLENDDGNVGFPRVSLDPAGNAVAVWNQDDGVRFNVNTNRYTVGIGWGSAELGEDTDQGGAAFPAVALDPTGSAVLVWQQYYAGRYDLWANRYEAGAGWGSAELLETDDAGDAEYADVAVDPSGNAIAVWTQNDGVRDNVWANRYAVGSGWGTPEHIDTGDHRKADSARVGMDSAGNAIAVWRELIAGDIRNIWARRYVVGTGWSAAELLETDAGSVAWPYVAVNADGDAVALWTQRNPTYLSVWANRYAVGSGWGTAELLETADGDVYDYAIGVDSVGNATAVWCQDDGFHESVWASRYVVGMGWQAATLIEVNDAGDAQNSHVAVDPAGNATAVWEQNDGSRWNIWANRYD